MYFAKGIGSRSRDGNLEITETRQVGAGQGAYVTVRELYGVTRAEDVPVARMRRLARQAVPDATRSHLSHAWIAGGCGHATFYLRNAS